MHLDRLCDGWWFIAVRNRCEFVSDFDTKRHPIKPSPIKEISVVSQTKAARLNNKLIEKRFSASQAENYHQTRNELRLEFLSFHTCNSFVCTSRHLICCLVPKFRRRKGSNIYWQSKQLPRLVCLSRTCVYVFFKINTENISSFIAGNAMPILIHYWH